MIHPIREGCTVQPVTAYQRGFADGVAVANISGPCHAPHGASGDYAAGYEDGYDACLEDKARRAVTR